MAAYWWLVTAAILTGLVVFGRWLARWTDRHPPIVPRSTHERQ